MDDSITNSEAIFNLINNGFYYLCPTNTPGIYWVRSVAGNWVKISAKPMRFDALKADFDKFIASGKISTELEVKNDNTNQIVIEPVPPNEGATIELKP